MELRHWTTTATLAIACNCISGCSDDPVSGAADASANSFDGQQNDAKVTTGCPPGFSGCQGGERWVCNDQGTGFAKQPCPEKTSCNEGQCVQCHAALPCAAGQMCEAGQCKVAPLAVVTTALPPALVGVAYPAKLEAQGGEPPYAWSGSQGALPPGLQLAATGTFDGQAKAAGSFSFQATVEDAKKSKVSVVLALDVKDGGLVVSTTSPLKAAVEGEPYSVQLQAQGGTAPHFWGVVQGKLPAGLVLGSDGTIAGTTTSDTGSTFDVKVLDNGMPTLTASKTLELPVKLAPLQIVGGQEVNLFITKLVVLPLIVVVDKVPVPYNAKLQAKGGKKPYEWQEVPLPGAVKSFLPNAGIPKGLTLAKDGTLSGSVTDASLVIEFKVPLSQLTLKGFFFAAEVRDSQSKPATKQAIFIIPTVPVG
jgi:hypothetical protein